MFGRHRAHWGRRGRRGDGCGSGMWHEGGFGPAFGVRRPLRYLAYKLDLDDDQVNDLARILKILKTERAQAEVDNQRSIGDLADAFGEDSFEAKAAEAALNGRAESAARIQTEVLKAVKETHELLEPEQRKQFAYLIRTGSLGI